MHVLYTSHHLCITSHVCVRMSASAQKQQLNKARRGNECTYLHTQGGPTVLQWIPLNRDRFLQPKKSRLTENPLYPKMFIYTVFYFKSQLAENPLYPNPD